MKQHLYTKLLILYFMLGGICFLLLSSGGSYLVEKRLERSTGESLYRTASQLVSKNELRQAVKNPKNESLTLALSSAAAFQNADFWVMDTDGNVLINTNQQSSDSGDITVRNFRPEDYEDTCYSSGTFYGTLKTTQLSTVVPIKDTDLVTGYLVIHYPMKNLYESRSNIVEVMILIFIVIYALFFSFLLIYFYRVHKPLKEILKGALEFANGNLTYTTRLSVEIQGIPYEKIEEFQEFIAKEGLETGGTGAKVRPVVSCKGTTCQYGLLDSYAISEEIFRRFYKGYRQVALPHKFKIAVGGCPNNCVKPNLNDVGIIGQRIPHFDSEACKGCKKCAIEAACPNKVAKVVDGKLHIDEELCRHCGRCVGKCPFHSIPDGTYGFKIYIGGRWGKKISHGKALNRIFTSEEEALDVIEKAILLFKDQGLKGERFAETIERIGFENAEKQLLEKNLLERKMEILSK